MADARGQSTYTGEVVPEVPGYRIERQLGRGSMGVVYLAEDVQLQRQVALKILAPTLADDELFRKRFDRESQSAAKLDHPHIVPVYAAGQGGGSLYIAMRYVSGGDVRTLLESSGPLSLAQATAVVESVADALDTAHAHGVIHRDVKPANILIDDRSERPHYYLSDFGITKLIAAGRSLTSAGQIIGTIDYIAPEQIQGKPVDGRADLYALGCVLYQCLTGVVPYPRDETSALMFAHLNDAPPSITARRPDLPPQIDTIVAKAIAKQPEDRYDTCRELAGALRLLARDPAGAGGTLTNAPAVLPVGPASQPSIPGGMTGTYIPPVMPPARPVEASESSGRRKWPWIVAGVLVLALAGGGTVGTMKYLNARFPNPAEKAVQDNLVPAALQKNCNRDELGEQKANVIASLVCTSADAGANQVTFTRFNSASALGNVYRSLLAAAPVTPTAEGTCEDAQQGDTTYRSSANQTNGQVVCYQQRGSSIIVWTDENARLLSQATRLDPDYMKLRNWWSSFEGLPTSDKTAEQKKYEQDLADANKRAEDLKAADEAAQKQQEADQKQRDADNAKALKDLQDQNAKQQQASQDALDQERKNNEQQMNDLRAQLQQSQNSQSQNSGGQDQSSGQSGRRGGRHSRGQNQDNTSTDSGGQDAQQQISDEVQRQLQQMGPGNQNPGGGSGNQDLRQQIADSVTKSILQGKTGNLDLSQLIQQSIKQSVQQGGG